MITCSICNGEGGWTDVIDFWIGGPHYTCEACNGKGKISVRKWLNIWLWEHAPEWYLDFLYERRKND